VPSATRGATRTATAWLKGAGSSVGKRACLNIRERTPALVFVNESYTCDTLTSAFQRVTATGTVQQTGSIVDVHIDQPAAGPGDGFFADVISLTPSG